MQRDNEFVLQAVGGETVLVPVGQKVLDLNGLLTLNSTGSFLWERLANPTTPDELVQALVTEFEVSAEQAKGDVAAFLASLEQFGAVSA